METLALPFLFAAGVGMAAIAAQHLVLWAHVRQAPPVPRRTPPVSLGVRVGAVLGKRVAIARRPVENVSERRTVRDFAGRYRRWGVLQRQAVGPVAYAALAVLNPALVAALAALADPTPRTVVAFASVCAAKAALDGAVARALRPGGFRLAQLACVPAKDLVFGAAWLHGLVRRDVVWRGKRIHVMRGTRIVGPARVEGPIPGPALEVGRGAAATS